MNRARRPITALCDCDCLRFLPRAVLCLFLAATAAANSIRETPSEGEKLPEGVQWVSLIKQSTLLLGIKHAFRLATEAGTREGLRGEFVGGYGRSVTSLHGWADGDEFYVNYVGHPMAGAVAGYIWVQNDPKFRSTEFSRSAEYWKSRSRALAFSWVYSTQFELGPFSEASIGKIQSQHPQQGLVDHVATPLFGLGWMMAEDSIDRLIIKPFEGRVRNKWARLGLRTSLNPARGMANLMRGQRPWKRDTRPGVTQYDPQIHHQEISDGLLDGSSAEEPLPENSPAPFEFSVPFEYLQFSGSGCVGGGGSGAFRLSPSWQMLFEVTGCKLVNLEKNVSGDVLAYRAGSQWTPQSSSRWSPYFNILLGGQQVSTERMFPEVKRALEAAARRQSLKPPDHALYTESQQANGFSLAVGGGVDVRLNRAVALRLGSVQYARSWLPPVEGRDFSNGLRVTSGLVFRFGTW